MAQALLLDAAEIRSRPRVHGGHSPHAATFTASADQVTPNNREKLRLLVRPWQMQALSLYDRCGATRNASQFLARPLSQVRLFPAVRTPDGEVEEIDDARAREILDRVQDPGGGRSNIQGQYGRLKFLIGESYLTQSADPDDPDGEQWEILSPAELRLNQQDTVVRLRAPNMPEPLQLNGEPSGPLATDEIRVWRLWNRHPAQSWLADSPTRAVLDLFEDLILLQQGVRARVVSRLAGNGILAIDDSITFPDLPTPATEPGAPEDPATDPFLDDLIEHFTTPIREPGSASAVVPYLLRLGTGGRPVSDLIQHITTRDPAEVFPETQQIDQILKRISIELDFPPEAFLGVSGSNHWSAWAIDDDTARTYIFPACQQMCDDLGSAYYRPACKEAGITDWRQMVIGYDAAALVNHPDRAKDAKDVFGAGELSGEGLRESTGLTQWPPSEDERRRYMAIKLRDPAIAPEGEGGDAANSDTADPTDGVDGTGGGQTTGPPPDGEPQDEQLAASANGNGSPGLSVHTIGRIAGMAESAVTRARAAAGSRVRGKRRSCEDCFQGLDDVPNGRVLAVLGQEMIRSQFGPITEAELVAGAAAEFAETAVRLGLEPALALELGNRLERHAAATLYEDEPGPVPFEMLGVVDGHQVLR